MITSLRKTQFLTQKVTNTKHELLAGGLQDSHESVSPIGWMKHPHRARVFPWPQDRVGSRSWATEVPPGFNERDRSLMAEPGRDRRSCGRSPGSAQRPSRGVCGLCRGLEADCEPAALNKHHSHDHGVTSRIRHAHRSPAALLQVLLLGWQDKPSEWKAAE